MSSITFIFKKVLYYKSVLFIYWLSEVRHTKGWTCEELTAGFKKNNFKKLNSPAEEQTRVLQTN